MSAAFQVTLVMLVLVKVLSAMASMFSLMEMLVRALLFIPAPEAGSSIMPTMGMEL